ncbi:MAG TPA: A24 family peptidase, partial [Gaiella sp.]|nr:A24 family peptidase [Gaiella sp.]
MTVRAVGLAVWIALAVACAVVFEDTTEAIVNALGCAVLVAVSVTDLERRIIPNRIIVPALVAALVVQTARDPSVEWLVAALAAGGFFLVLALVYPAGLGMGDVKLAAFMGAWLGWDVAVAL